MCHVLGKSDDDVEKVKGHATDLDVLEGRISQLDLDMNHTADRLAVASVSAAICPPLLGRLVCIECAPGVDASPLRCS